LHSNKKICVQLQICKHVKNALKPTQNQKRSLVLPSILYGCPPVILITLSRGEVFMIVILKSNLGISKLDLKFGQFMECNSSEPFHFKL